MRSRTAIVACAAIALWAACKTREESRGDIAETAPTDCSGGASDTVVFATTMGDIRIELFRGQAPVTVDNFLAYVETCFYDGTVFHRVVPGFVLQGGGLMQDLQPKTTRDPIINEAANGLKNLRGSLSMARRSEEHSATSQFFINLVDNTILDHGVRDFGYAVFARVIGGMDVVDEIAAVHTGTREGMENVPLVPVVISRARRL